jgi:hypothetical protein
MPEKFHYGEGTVKPDRFFYEFGLELFIDRSTLSYLKI